MSRLTSILSPSRDVSAVVVQEVVDVCDVFAEVDVVRRHHQPGTGKGDPITQPEVNERGPHH